MSVQSVQYKLETFEGPLDLLLHLIDRNEVDIYNIPISDITDQYMEYIATMQQFELDVASEFLVMAATLLSIKSKMLLPKPPVVQLDEDGEQTDIDPRMELVQKLLEYRKYKGIAEVLREKELGRSLLFTREPEDLTPFMNAIPSNPLDGIHVADLIIAFQRMMKKATSRTRVARIERDEISVKDRIVQVLDLLRQHGGRVLFSRLMDEEMDRQHIVVTFLAILELMKRKSVTCYQHALFEDIVIQEREGGTDVGLLTDEIDY